MAKTQVDQLEDVLSSSSKTKRFAFLRSPWPGVYFLLILIWLKLGGIQDRVFKAVDSYTTAPVLVQVGSNGQPILARQSEEGNLNPKNVKAYVSEIIPLLNRFDTTLPAESGGGLDKGVTLPNSTVKVPSPVFLALQGVDTTAAPKWTETHMQSAPKDLWKGAKSTLQNVKVSESTGTGNTRTVTVQAIQVTDNPDGSPRSAQLWARKVTVAAVQKPRWVLEPSLIQRKYNAMLGRGLQIQLPMLDAPEVLP